MGEGHYGSGAGGWPPHHPSWSGKPGGERYCPVISQLPTGCHSVPPNPAVIQGITLAQGL